MPATLYFFFWMGEAAASTDALRPKPGKRALIEKDRS